MHEDDAATERLLLRLRALGSLPRVHLLRALVTPSRSSDLRIRAAGERAGLGAERFLGRSTIIEHLDILEEAGLVRRVGEHYAIDQQGMVALLQDLGGLARLRALVDVDVEATRPAPQPSTMPLVAPPRLLVVNGPEAGRAFALSGAGPWRLGRTADCEVPLAHDPHVSRTHATLAHKGEGFRLDVSSSAKNPVFVDFAAVEPGHHATLRSCAVLNIGATALVLQA